MNASLLPAERVSLTLRGLYQSFGFAETGEMDGDERIAVLRL